ncbi:MAG TPA: hypothetical protein DC024_07345 [Clostridiales bacterium]|jgi:sucrose-6-phosphate hydrolase SacC (GH32 family)|nr:hypothetical protein [Clostridiales bacterium]
MKKNICTLLILILLLAACSDNANDQPEFPDESRLENDYSIYPLKTTVHYKDGTNAVGDVIPFYYQGEYHVFYLQGDEWAHIVSTDLVNWRVLPFALRKGTGNNSPDGQGIWTGSVVYHDSKFYIFYTGKNTNDTKGEQKVMVAESSDLINWTKIDDRTMYADGKIYWNKTINGAIDDKQSYHHQAFRDPLVFFNHKDNKWWMILHAVRADGSRPVMGLYTSLDMKNWIPREPWVVYPNSVSGDCPDVFYENNEWYILCANYVYMRIDNINTITDPFILPYDCGDLCVPKTMYDGKRRIAIGWITDYEGHQDSGAGGWGGIMSMPRELYTDRSGKLMQRPIEEVIGLFPNRISQISTSMNSGEYSTGLSKNFMLTAEIRPQGNPDWAELRVCASGKDDLENYYLKIDFKNKRIWYGSKYRSYDRTFPYMTGDTVKIQWFVEGTVAECFVNDAYCFTMRAYDKIGNGIVFKSNETTTLNNLTVFSQ